MSLSVAYITSRKDPRIQWFADSLRMQAGDGCPGIQIIVVDFYAQACDDWMQADVDARLAHFRGIFGECDLRIVPPKSCVWQGPSRLTQVNWFAASNSRNTAICLAKHEWLVFVDDLSVLMPGWLDRVRAAMASNIVTLGAYKKVKNLAVESGIAVAYDEFAGGTDSRWPNGSDSGSVQAAGSWLFGCSFAAPIDALLSTNGMPEHCDGLGFEDCIMGIALEKKGWRFAYDRRMLTLESEELHHVGAVMKRSDYGKSPHDKSHAVLNQAMHGNGWHANYFDEGGIAALRQRVLAGEPFPIQRIPEHEWWTGTRLEDL